MAWPPVLAELKNDMSKDKNAQVARDDQSLQRELDAAVSFVERVRPRFRYDLTDPAQLSYPEPTADLRLGTLRLAARWDARRRSPDAVINMQEMGVGRVTSGDADIDRLLRIGRHQIARVG
jgi:hypothetical protein